MKIIIFAPYFYPHQGGVENYCFEIAQRFSQKKLKIFIATSKFEKEKDFEKMDNFFIYRLSSYNLLGNRWPVPKLSWSNMKKIVDLVNIKPDAIITNTRFFPLSLIAAIIFYFQKAKLIHIEHGTRYSSMENKLSEIAAKIYDNIFGRIILSISDQVIGISKAASKFAEYLGAKKTNTIPNSVDTKVFLNKFEIRKNVKKITYVGRLIQAKGVQDLIKAFKEIKNKNLELQIIGSGNYEKKLKQISKSDQRIKFLGQKNLSEIKKILAKTDIFVNPSYSEGLPTSVLEAGSMNIPIIATNVGGTNEIIINNKNGFLIPIKKDNLIKEKINKLVKDDILRMKFSKNIRNQIISKFSWDQNIEKIYKIIKNA